LIAPEEEQFVFKGGAAKREAPLVAFQGIRRLRKEIVGVEKAVADEPEYVAVVEIGAGCGAGVASLGMTLALLRWFPCS